MIESCIDSLRIGDKKIALTAFVKAVGEIQTAKSGIDYQRLTLTDDTGETTVTLFGDECDKIPKGAWIECKNCYCTEYQGNVQFNKGKWGSITVIESAKKAPRPVSKSTPTPLAPTGGSNAGNTVTLADINNNLAQFEKNIYGILKTITVQLKNLEK